MKDKRYIILGIDDKGQYWGYTEHSFCMGFSKTEVRVWAPKYKGTSTSRPNPNQLEWNWCCEQAAKLNKRQNKIHWRAYRVGSKHCPVKLDFTPVELMKKKKIKYDKYNYRNQKFTVI